MNNAERLIDILNEIQPQLRAAGCSAGAKVRFAHTLIEKGVVVLPCKIGDPVFIINKKGYIHTGKFRMDDLDQIGKRVFLTKAEAEKALKGVVDNV